MKQYKLSDYEQDRNGRWHIEFKNGILFHAEKYHTDEDDPEEWKRTYANAYMYWFELPIKKDFIWSTNTNLDHELNHCVMDGEQLQDIIDCISTMRWGIGSILMGIYPKFEIIVNRAFLCTGRFKEYNI